MNTQNTPEVTDDELEGLLHNAILALSSDQIADCYVATKFAAHLVNQMRIAGVVTLRSPY
jgi:hypothetical protein